MAKLVVIGKHGQLAWELKRELGEQVICLGRDDIDITSQDSIESVLNELQPSAIINASAYTAVDKAETEQEAAFLLNEAAVANLAAYCESHSLFMVHVSTDYVFNGIKGAPYTVDDDIAPQGVYGQSKAAGENALLEILPESSCILRTSWVYSSHGNNFVKTMLRLSETRDTLTVVADQIGGPTSARAIAKACVTIAGQLQADPAKAGIYHFSGAPDASWADFAREIFAQAGRGTAVEDIPTTAFPTPAKRPPNSRMDCTTTSDAFGITRPDWKADLTGVLKELEALQDPVEN